MPDKVAIVFELTSFAKGLPEETVRRMTNTVTREVLGRNALVALAVEPNFEVMVE